MPDKPVPLREALKEAVEALIEAAEPEMASNVYHVETLMASADDLRRLIEQVPAEIEVNDAE